VDRILIKDLALRGFIGVTAEERREKQDIVINMALETDLGKAGLSDDLADTVDYKALKKRILALVEGSQFLLVEALAEKIAALGLEDPRVERVTVTVEKPGALRFARSVGVEITRERRSRA
jgi:FolB domain-containing protein